MTVRRKSIAARWFTNSFSIVAALLVVIVRMIGVSGEHGKDADEFETLAQRISDARIQCVVVIVGIGKDTAHHRFHDVAGRSLHNYISGEVRGISSRFAQNFFEFGKLII